MNKKTFQENLMKTLEELSNVVKAKIGQECKFLIIPVQEESKPHSSKDDVMRLWLFSDKNIKDKFLDLDTVISLFSGFDPLFPLWITVSVKEKQEEITVIELQTSLRFRKPSELHNQDTGHAPFRAVY